MGLAKITRGHTKTVWDRSWCWVCGNRPPSQLRGLLFMYVVHSSNLTNLSTLKRETLIVFLVAYCDIPNVAHGHVAWVSSHCNITSGIRRHYHDGVVGFGELYIACDPEYHLVGYGYLVCAGYNRFRTPIPTCQGKI